MPAPAMALASPGVPAAAMAPASADLAASWAASAAPAPAPALPATSFQASSLDVVPGAITHRELVPSPDAEELDAFDPLHTKKKACKGLFS